MSLSLAPAASRGFDFADLYAIGLAAAGLAVIAAVIALSRRHDRPFTPAVIYLVMGAVASIALNRLGVDLLDPLPDAHLIERAAELAVIIALFSAGIRLDRPLGWPAWDSPMRLIVIVMPLTIAGVAAFAGVAMGLSIGAAIVLGAVLAPTDPVLADDVQVGGPGSEEREPHFALTSEAGLNDGLAFPFVFLGLYVADAGGGWLTEWLAADVLYAIAAGIGLGVLIGHLLGLVTRAVRERGWLLAEYDSWLAVAAVLTIYGVTEVAGAYGFLAAFAGGLAFRRHATGHESHARIHHGAETAEKLSELALVLVLGSTVTLLGLSQPGVAGWLLVPVLIVLIRPLAVFAAFLGSPTTLPERAFIGWFGIRGIGSFYYAAVAIGAGVLTPAEQTVIYWTVVVCAGISIIVHGISATPASRRLRRRAGSGSADGPGAR